MSLIKISNSDYVVDFNDLEFLTWSDGWNGGSWNNWECLRNPEKFKFFLTSDKDIFEIDVLVKEVGGVDYDMGHQYSWNTLMLFVKKDCDFSEILVDFRDIKKGFEIMYLKLSD